MPDQTYSVTIRATDSVGLFDQVVRDVKIIESDPIAIGLLAKVVSWWELLETLGTRFDSHSSNHLTTVTDSFASEFATIDAPGSGRGVKFGSNAYALRPGNQCVGLNPAVATYEVVSWCRNARALGNGSAQIMWGKCDDSAVGPYLCAVAGSVSPAPERGYSTSEAWGGWTGKRIFTDSDWHFVSSVKSSGRWLVEVDADGNRVDTAPASNANTSYAFRIGSVPGYSTVIDTAVGQTIWFSSPLSAEERSYLYNGGIGRTYAAVRAAAGL